MEEPQTVKLSVCMIVRNEEAALPRCLKSIEGVGDECVIVDTGSTDRTPEIARAFGATVHFFDWCDDFSAARNQSLTYAQGEWVLVLDADEVLLPAIVPALKQAIQQPNCLVINLLRHEVGAKQAPYSLVSRLFRRHAEIAFARPYHELIDDSVAAILQREPHWKVMQLPGVAIEHTGYQPDAIAQRDKRIRARTIMGRYLIAHPEDVYICNKLGALYVEEGEIAKGLKLLEWGLQSKQAEPPILYELHYHLGDTYRQLQNFSQAEFHYRLAVEQSIASHLKIGAYNSWGNLLMDQGEFVRAKTLYQTIVAVDPTFAVGHYNLAMALKASGKLSEAIAQYQTAIQLNPAYAEAYQNLGVALLKGGNLPASLEAFQQAIILHQQQGSPEADRIRDTLSSMGFVL